MSDSATSSSTESLEDDFSGRHRASVSFSVKVVFFLFLQTSVLGPALFSFSDSPEEETLTDGLLLLSGASHPEIFDTGDL